MIKLVNQTLGQYRIEALLGTGGMGEVFRGRHLYLDRPAAIKVMHAHLAADPTFRARFLREAKAAAALKHPNIVEVYEFGEHGGHLYLVMELMTAGSVRSLLQLRAGHPLPLALALDLMHQAAEGLAAAHAQGIVHRDIKPDNLLLNPISGSGQIREQYQLKISDFGLARMAEGGRLTTTAGPIGTLAYMSPEQCQSLPLDGRSDLYSLGVVLYEVATGYRPFQINTLTDAFNKHVHVAPRPPRELCPNLPPSLETIILRCLAKKPEERYATATELAGALQALQGRSTSPVAPRGKTELQAPGAEAWSPPAVSTLPGTSPFPRVRVLDQRGQTLQVVEVKRQGLAVGREPGNDLVLSSEAVSRHHLQVRWDGKQVSVKDLGSSNGTLLEGIRLLPQESQPWLDEQWMRIGPYWLRLEGTRPAQTQLSKGVAPQTAKPGTPGARQTAGKPPTVSSNRIGIAVTPQRLNLTPGQAARLQVTLTNLGSTVDWFTPTVEGVPPDWVQGTGEAVQLNPGMQQTVDLSVNVARTARNHAGDYPVTIRARSREKPNEAGIVQAHWTVLPFKEDAVDLKPRRASGRGGASYTVTLHNGGNAPAQYALSGEDDEQQLAYRFRHNPVALEPGREVGVPLQVSGQHHWFGRKRRQPFQIHARPAGSSSSLTTAGELVNKALLPGWLLAVALVIVVLALVRPPIPLWPQPVVTSITPKSGSHYGGDEVIIRGSGFTGATTVSFGSKSAHGFRVDSGTQILAVSPDGAENSTVDVTVTTLGGTSETSEADKFYYTPVTPEVTPSPSPLPDLSVAAIELFQVEGQPIRAGKMMALNVYVKNTGDAPSGPYHVLIFIKDVTRGSTYPHGEHAESSMNPGEQYAVYSTETSVNFPGQYEVHVEITLDTKVDANPQNNTAVLPFTAV